jgi:hypothetical protein
VFLPATEQQWRDAVLVWDGQDESTGAVGAVDLVTGEGDSVHATRDDVYRNASDRLRHVAMHEGISTNGPESGHQIPNWLDDARFAVRPLQTHEEWTGGRLGRQITEFVRINQAVGAYGK